MSLPDQPTSNQHKETLLRALEQIEDAERETGGEIEYLVVGYQIDCQDDDDSIRIGWLSSGMDDRWIIAAFFSRLARFVGKQS